MYIYFLSHIMFLLIFSECYFFMLFILYVIYCWKGWIYSGFLFAQEWDSWVFTTPFHWNKCFRRLDALMGSLFIGSLMTQFSYVVSKQFPTACIINHWFQRQVNSDISRISLLYSAVQNRLPACCFCFSTAMSCLSAGKIKNVLASVGFREPNT